MTDSTPEPDDLQPYCTRCGSNVGIFIDHGDGWRHFTGSATLQDPNVLYDAGHEPVVAWRDPEGQQ